MSTTLIYSFNGNGNATYSIGSLVSWHPSALIADQIKVFLNGTELTNSSANGFTINEADRSITFRESSSDHAIGGSEIVKLQRVTPDTFFSTLETVGAASGAAALSNDRQLLNRIQETENSIVVAAANTSIKDNQDRLVSILNPGTNVGFSHDSTTNTLTISSSGGGGGGGSITLTFAENSNTVESGTSFTLSSANTGFASTSAVAAAYYTQTQVNSLLGAYVQTSGFNTLFDNRFTTQIAPYNVKNLAAGSNITLTESPAGTFTIAATAAASVSSLNGETGALTLDMRTDAADDGPPNTIGLSGCDHTPTDSSKTVTTASQHTSVDGWSWIHDSTAGSFVTHKPLSGTRNSELIGGKTLTVSGTIAGDSNNDINLAAGDVIHQPARASDRDHIKPQWQEQRNGSFSLSSGFYQTNDDKHGNDVLYLAGLDNNEADETNLLYVYPEAFLRRTTNITVVDNWPSQVDLTGYNPERKLYAASTMTRPLFYPGFDYSLQNTAPISTAQVATQTKGNTAAYYTAAGISEPLPGSGNIRANAPLRLFNVSSLTKSWTATDLGHSDIAADRSSYMNPMTGSPHTANKYSLYPNTANSGASLYQHKPNIIYVPGNADAGILQLTATIKISASRPRAYMFLFTGMDEPNKNIGTKESIIPVAGRNVSDTGAQTFTLTYNFDASDGLPRYFGFGVGGDDNVSDLGVFSWTLSRGSYNAGTYHDTTISESNNTTWNYARGSHDPYIRNAVITNAVSQ